MNGVMHRAIVTILEGSERAQFQLTPASLVLQSVDALQICVFQFEFRPHLFQTWSPALWSVQCNMRTIYDALRQDKKLTSVVIRDNTLFLNQHAVSHQPDQTQYVELQRCLYFHWPHFSAFPSELFSIILDLAVCGSVTQLELTPGGTIRFRTKSESGSILIESAATSKILRNLPQVTVCNRYITKFLKQIHQVAIVTEEITVYAKHQGPVVLYCSLAHDVQLVVCIAPIKDNAKLF